MQHNGCDKGDGTAVSLKVMRYRYSYLSLSKEGANKDVGHVKQERRMEQLYRKKKDKFLYLFLYIFVSYVLIFND